MVLVKRDSLFVYLLVISVFTKSFEVYFKIGSIGVDIYSYIVFPIVFLVMVTSFSEQIPKYLLFSFIGLFIIQLISSLFLTSAGFSFLYQFLPIVIFYTVAFFLVKKEGVVKVFLHYYKLSIIVAIFGIIQYTFGLFGFDLFVHKAGRLNSILPEASHYACVVMPAVVFSLLYKVKLYEKLILTSSLILTFSSTAYLVLFIVLIFHSFDKIKKVLKFFPFAIGFLFLLYTSVDDFRYKLDDTLVSIVNPDLYLMNATTFSFVSNAYPALDMIMTYPISGGGLGMHDEIYENYYSEKRSDIQYHRLFGLNKGSGHSLLLRLMSELGFIGLGFLAYIFTQFYRLRKKSDSKSILYIISLSCFSVLVFRMFKLGGYFDYGLPIFIMLLLFSTAKVRESA